MCRAASSWITLLLRKLCNPSVPLSPFVCLFSHSVSYLDDGCHGEIGVFPSPSLAYCRRAPQAVQPASWETAVPELSVWFETHRSARLTLPFNTLLLLAWEIYAKCTAKAILSFSFALYLQCTNTCVLLFFVAMSAIGGLMFFFVWALDCTVPPHLVIRHWNGQASLCGRCGADPFQMWMDRVDCLQPLQSLSRNIITSDAVQVWSALLPLDKVTVRLIHLIFITQRPTSIVTSHAINLNLDTQGWWSQLIGEYAAIFMTPKLN